MIRLTLLAVATLALLANGPSRLARACDGIAFSAGACYSQALYAPSYSYAAAAVVPAYVQDYAPPPQQVIAPVQVQVVRPEYRLKLQQVQAYQSPVYVQKQVAVQAYAAPVLVQKQVVQKYAAPQRIVFEKQQVVVQKQVVAKVHAPSLSVRTTTRRGLLGRTIQRSVVSP